MQKPPYPVCFLSQADGIQGGSAFTLNYKNTPYTKLPFMHLKHFAKFRSFLNPDGSYGVVLYTKPEMRQRLYTATLENQGKRVLPVVNGLAFEPLYIDRPILDGTLVIWAGLNGYDLKQIARTVDPVTPEIEKKRYLSKNPRPLPKMPKDATRQKDATGRTMSEIFSYQQ